MTHVSRQRSCQIVSLQHAANRLVIIVRMIPSYNQEQLRMPMKLPPSLLVQQQDAKWKSTSHSQPPKEHSGQAFDTDQSCDAKLGQ